MCEVKRYCNFPSYQLQNIFLGRVQLSESNNVPSVFISESHTAHVGSVKLSEPLGINIHFVILGTATANCTFDSRTDIIRLQTCITLLLYASFNLHVKGGPFPLTTAAMLCEPRVASSLC